MEKKESDSSSLGVVIATPEESLWSKVKEAAEREIKSCNEIITIQTELLRLANEKTANLQKQRESSKKNQN